MSRMRFKEKMRQEKTKKVTRNSVSRRKTKETRNRTKSFSCDCDWQATLR